MRLIPFYERQAFNHWQKHFVNPDEVSSLSQVGYETWITFKSGKMILVSDPIEEVRKKLTEEDGEDSAT